jgi:serine/threonine protein kinase
MLRPQPISTIAYAFVRRFAARKGNEAVMVLLEDITQFERIGAPQSRLKWARAIVASVVAELARNAIVASVVGPPSGALTVAGSNVHPAWLVISSTVNGTHAAGALADGLFMPVYRAVARAVVRDIMPAFTGSPEHRSLLMLARSLAQLLAGNGTMLPGPVAQPLLDPAVTIAQLSCMPLNASFFDKLGVIGSGSYGSVYAWRLKLSGQVYAVKICSKLLLKSKASVHTVVRELACSLAADSPFLMTPSFAFHDNENLHIGLPFLERGDLERWLLAQPTKRFDENIARWYTAQLVLGLRRLHSCGVIHRDLKASNLLVDRNGYLQLSDFGLSVFAHRCSKVQPEYTRPCWGEKSEQSLTACCLGCSLCSKLKVLQTLAEENEKRMPAKQAGQEAAQAFHLTGDRPDGTGRATRAFSRGTASRGSRDSRGESMEPAAGGGGGQGTGPGAMPATSGDDPYAGTAKASRGFFRLWGSKIATDPKAKPVGGLTSAHALTPPGILPSAASKATVDPDGDASMDLGQPLASAFSNVSTGPAQYDSPPYLGTGGLADAEDLLSPTAVMRNAPNARAPLEEGYINSTVMVLQDCTCTAEQDDGTCQWYRGRAGTAAYWAPQMLSRDAQHERLTYSFEADFWSLGCLTYALMTGRSPFASGLGSAHDNSMTLEGRIAWPKGIFSPTAKAFISCLCTVEPGKRLGAGKSGWAAVMKHPW